MTYVNFPASLPYLDALHSKDAWNTLINDLPKDDVTELEMAEQLKETHPFIDALDKMEDFMKGKNMTLTENGDPIHSTTHDACLDLFHGIETEGQHQIDLLEKAWAENRDLTLHIIFYARSIHRGKGLKLEFLTAFCWLLQKAPKTAILNLEILASGTIKSGSKQEKVKDDSEDWDMLSEFKEKARVITKSHGCWKDLATILTIYCQGELKGPQSFRYKALGWPCIACEDISHRENIKSEKAKRWDARKKMDPETRAKDAQHFIDLSQKRSDENKAKAHENRLLVRQERNQHVTALLTEDKVYQALHSTIARLFADQLLADMDQLEINKKTVEEGLDKQKYALSNKMSLAAKWAPSLKHAHDRSTFLATSIAEILFPPNKYQEENETRVHYLNKCLAPLREAIDSPERRMSRGKWDTIDYSHVPSICLKNNIGHFFKHAPDRVVEYMNHVQKGKKKVAGSTLTPNQLVYKVCRPTVPKALKDMPDAVLAFTRAEINMVNGQWDSLLSSTRDIGQMEADDDDDGNNRVGLSESIAVCDVSGSMFNDYGSEETEDCPIFAAVGLSLMISNLTKSPFNGHVISFTDIPSLLSPNTSLPFSEQVKVIQNSHVGYSTNLRAVFTDLLLPMAKKYNLRQEDMVKRIFVFSDMEFNSQCTGSAQFLTTYESIRNEYKDAGYEMPELVWWNLSNIARKVALKAPVIKYDEGVCLLHGFSASMVKTFLDGDLSKTASMDTDTENDDAKTSVEKGYAKTSVEKGEKKKLTPIDFMNQAVYHESFQGLKVFD
ncbi:hypothetical protein K501DRAFT_327570 [Backusella circina FSU 941]|nr:hypothetical protein K501DRAFT_327570 [Backusella circina FSU 941]